MGRLRIDCARSLPRGRTDLQGRLLNSRAFFP